MALSKLRASSTVSLNCRYFSSILNPKSSSPLSRKEKSRATLSLLKTEKNPERILDICRAASLNPIVHLDRISFSVAISKLKDSNYFEGIRIFLEELKTNRSDLRNEGFLRHFIVLYGEAGMLDNAFLTFEQVFDLGIERTVKSLNALLFSCILAKNYGEAKRVFFEFPRKYGVVPNLDTYNTVIKAFCESGSSSSVHSILAEMDRKKVTPNATTFGICIAGFYKERKFEDVQKMLKLMKKYNMKPGVSIYNIRIQSMCKLKRTGEAKALLNGMLSEGVKVNSVTYCHLIRGFCNEGNLDQANNMFKEMVSHGYQPDSNCYFTLVYFLCQGEDFETASKICKESIAKGWFPNFSTMKLLVNGLATISKVDEARELVEQIKERFSKSSDIWNEIEESLTK